VSYGHTFLVVWADADAPLPAGAAVTKLASTVADEGGELLALSPVSDVVEVAPSRPVPPWGAIARFPDQEAATRWHALDLIPGVAIVVPAHPEPVWWPDDRAAERPDWSRRGDVPDDRTGLFVSVWIAEANDLDSLIDYSGHFRWTVERHDGVSLGNVPLPTTLAGQPAPVAMTLMTWNNRDTALAWYGTAEYRPYRDQRHAASSATVIGIPAFPTVEFPPRAPDEP
jgi:uncharacterized protein (DUF1330 family)